MDASEPMDMQENDDRVAEGMGTAWAMGFKGCVLDEHKLVIAWDSECMLSSE